MSIATDIAEILADPDGPASLCLVEVQGQDPREVLMIAKATHGAPQDPRNRTLVWMDAGSSPRGADWGYGLMLAADAPEDMHDDSVFHVLDSLGTRWRVEGAKALTESIDGALHVMAWRLALRGTQRALRTTGGR